MKKTIITVFLIIGALVLALLVWRMVFAKGGLLNKGWDGVAGQVNKTWQKLTGDSTDEVMAEWQVDGSQATVDAGTGNFATDLNGGGGGGNGGN